MADFFAKKKKTVKAQNFNEDKKVAEKVKKEKKSEWKEEEQQKEVVVSPKGKVANLADIKAEEDSKKHNPKSWNAPGQSAAPQTHQVSAKGGGRYMAPQNAPGAISDRKYPTLGTNLVNTNIEVGEVKRKENLQSNAFANLACDESSDDEDGKVLRMAHMKKQKGVNAQEMLDAHSRKYQDDVVDEEEAEKMRKEAEAKKKKQAEKKHALDETVAKREEDWQAKKAAEREAAEKARGAFAAKFDPSKFQYGQFDILACEEKYQAEEMLAKKLPAYVMA